MSLLLLFPGARSQIQGAGGISSFESFGSGLQVALGELSFAGTGDSYLSHPSESIHWNFAPAQVLSALPILGVGAIRSHAAMGRPSIGGGLQVNSLSNAQTISRPVISRSFIVQDEEFLMLYA